jgi:uncharacterized membrane protein YgdD (TMEM256/DUF423 family)
MAKLFLVFGAVSAFFAVALGAFGAHALKMRLAPDLLAIYHTAVQYHFWHALGLFIVGVLALRFPDMALIKWSGWLMVVGTVIFSGSLYILSLSGLRMLGALTPLGGVAFLAAWFLLGLGIWKALSV